METERIIQGRCISPDTVAEIRGLLAENPAWNRTRLSRELCEGWDWRNEKGLLKDMACREVLLTLQRKGLISLPPRRNNANNEKRNRKVPVVEIEKLPVRGKPSDFEPVRLQLVRNTSLEPLYNSLIQQHHYLGYRQIVGNHLKYMAFIGKRPVACIGWGSAAWSVKSRETFVGWNKKTKENNLHFVANNTRFLILPWVLVKCLASKILALNAKRISNDWLSTYNHPLYLLETFVEQNRFKGTCYKAANWILTGQTKGTAKRGHDHLFHGKIKDVYLYTLRKDFKQKLMG